MLVFLAFPGLTTRCCDLWNLRKRQLRIIVSFVVARILVFIKARSPSSISVVGVGVCVGAGVVAVFSS